MPDIQMPDGTVVRFPDDMPRDQINAAIFQKHPELNPQTQPKNYSLSEVPGAALSNIPSDIGTIASNIGQRYNQVGALGIGKDIAKTAIGMGQELIPGQQRYETQYADPMYARMFKDWGVTIDPNKQAGSFSGIGFDPEQTKRNIAEHPAQAALDVSMFAAPAESLPGRAGEIARLVNPVNVAGRAVSNVAKLPIKYAKYHTGEVSGLGPQVASEAYSSGKVTGRNIVSGSSGPEGQAFREQYFGYGDPNAPVDTSRDVVGQLRKEKSAAYNAGMENIRNQSRNTMQRLDIKPIEDAFNRTAGIQQYVGHAAHEMEDPAATAAVRGKIKLAIDEWKADPGAQTTEGFDALKQRIQSIGLSEKQGSPGSLMVGRVATVIKNEIKKQDPQYEVTMKAYGKAANAIDELTNTFGLGRGRTYDTALRKLQSVLRNNAFTNYTARAKLAALIQEKAPTLMPALAGQAANSILPRGLAGKLLTGGTGLTAATLAAVVSANPMILIPLFASLASGSPKLIGGVAHGAGIVAGATSAASRSVPGIVTRTALAATPRIAALDHASKVLTHAVLKDAQTNPDTRVQLADWLKARTSGSGEEQAAINFGDALAGRLGKPELADRIARELLGSQQ